MFWQSIIASLEVLMYIYIRCGTRRKLQINLLARGVPAGIGCCLMATIGVGDSSTAVDEPAQERRVNKRRLTARAEDRKSHSLQPQS